MHPHGPIGLAGGALAVLGALRHVTGHLEAFSLEVIFLKEQGGGPCRFKGAFATFVTLGAYRVPIAVPNG